MDDPLYQRGLRTRREILGDAHADRVESNLDPVTQPFQDLVVRYGWGEVWSRPGLDRRSRSIATLSMMLAQGRQRAFKLHVTGALNNGLTRDEIVELVVHAAVYCGAPAAEEALRWVKDAFEELRPQDPV
jgi:alkylhydroperoxidase/carboxymuconolactone decarboxylase family protein YurZ